MNDYNMDYLDENFDAKDAIEGVTNWIIDFFEKNGKGCNAIIGISGGKDSSVAAALLVRALGKDRVIGVMMPNKEQADISFSKMLVNHLGIRNYTIDICEAYNGIINNLKDKLVVSNQTRINLAPRLRMATLYAVSQSSNGRVVNTCNLSEDWVGYSTRYGDAAGDFSPLSKFTVGEIKAMGKELGLPLELVEKKPSDGLCGKTDEENLGFTYATLDRYIRTGKCEDLKVKEIIDKKHAANLFKLEMMPCYER